MIHRVQFIRTHVKIGLVMALELRDIPVLEGKTAERFINEAEANVKNPKKSHSRFLTLDEFERIELNSKIREDAEREDVHNIRM